MTSKHTFALDDGLDLGKLLTTGSVLQINENYDESDLNCEPERESKTFDFFGQPITSFEALEKEMVVIDASGLVKKKIIEEGGGLPLHKGCTVSVAYSGYWENELEPFDVRDIGKPLAVDLQNNGLLPGLLMAIESMLVGESAVFLLSYRVMYGELGIIKRIKPKSDCVFYIKLIKSFLTPKEGPIVYSEQNMFERVYHDVKMLFASGVTLNKNKNRMAAIQLFRKAVFALHKCRLANEEEEKKQENMLKKLYINLAICYNIVKQPLRACIACNELNRLNSLWNNGKVLLQNAKALRMIGQYDEAEKKIKRAMMLCPGKDEIEAELDMLNKIRKSCNQTKLVVDRGPGPFLELVSDGFKKEVDNLIKNFKENEDICKLTLPASLNSEEIDYLREVCVKENLFIHKIREDYALDKVDKTSEYQNNDKEVDELCDWGTYVAA